MYKRRLYICIGICIAAAAVCLARLLWLQGALQGQYRQAIADMRVLDPRQLPTIRGSILDRNGNTLAGDRPAFFLNVSYQLTRLMDDRFWQMNLERLQRLKPDTPLDDLELELREEYQEDRAKLARIIDEYSEFRIGGREEIEDRIREINDDVWHSREFHAWSRQFPDSPLRTEYRRKGQYIPRSRALEEFYELFPDSTQRRRLVYSVNLPEMHEFHPLIELAGEEERLQAQLAFVHVPGVRIRPQSQRVYPYGSAACHIIGWIGRVHRESDELFVDDEYSKYLHGEIAGKAGVEKACEAVLRGRRGEVVYDIEGNMLDQKDTVFGKDVVLALDIELQQKVEQVLADPNETRAIGAVVIDVATSDVLVLASVPTFELGRVRVDYNKIRQAPGKPMVSRAFFETYPPGSTAKPFVCVAGLEEGKVGPREVISCPFERAPRYWPNCLQFSRFHSCHDWKWQGEGGNIAYNAIRGSCNIYFSRLADRIPSRAFQRWLYDFGFGRRVLQLPDYSNLLEELRRPQDLISTLPESQGQISSKIPSGLIGEFEDVPPLRSSEKRFFGIGQGSMRVTVLQAANGLAALARDGVFKEARLFLDGTDPFNDRHSRNLGLKSFTIETVQGGMYAVVNEWGGTGRRAFENSYLLEPERGMRIYGKTGSTERPYHAWFAGFALDDRGQGVALAVVVEGGKAGSTDAAPVAREILGICHAAGYVGQQPTSVAMAAHADK